MTGLLILEECVWKPRALVLRETQPIGRSENGIVYSQSAVVPLLYDSQLRFEFHLDVIETAQRQDVHCYIDDYRISDCKKLKDFALAARNV